MKLFTNFSNLRRQLEAQTDIVSKQDQLIGEASEFIKEIEKGNLNIEVSNDLINNKLGVSLLSMQNHLTKIAEEEKERTWTNVGLAKFSDILRNKESHDIQELANNILKNLVKYVGANQGGLFVLEDHNKEDEHLRMIACYAYDRKKYLNKRIEIGEGLAGQCILERESIYLTEVPADYVHITSGLGNANPRMILMTPLLINEKIFGVLELASFDAFQPYKIDFIARLSENIASSIKNVKDNAHTLTLLNASQVQSEELRAQEEEMRQNMEELQATQEEMVRKSDEIARTMAEMESILKGINVTMATIEFTPEGIILNANTNFLATMKCSLEDIKGKHHSGFVPKEILEGEEYKTFWSKLASGKSTSGIFKRINAKGETIWLNAVYNPILDANGGVLKVVKFATDITMQQEMLAENKGIMSGINATMATIEFTPEGNVLSANANFLKVMKYEFDEIKGIHHRKFVSTEVQKTKGYQLFWKRLASGEAISGVFERVNANGETVWLNAIYNPILNASGEVVKVVKFASDITAEKAKMVEMVE